MKAIKVVTILFLLTFAITVDASSHPRFRNHQHNYSNNDTKPTVGAPLDGGILAILGAAGIGYFVTRKRKKNQ
jgi:hypothetical protein